MHEVGVSKFISPMQSAFRHVSSKHISDFVLEQLEEAIFLKEILPDEQLPPERELAQMFNASRMVVREAIAELEKRGLVEKRLGAKGGTFVLPIAHKALEYAKEQIVEQKEQLKELLEFRSIIEPEAAGLAAVKITDEELGSLRKILDTSIQDCTREQYRSLDVKFHLLIAHASRNSFIENAVRQIRKKINLGLDLLPFDDQIKATSNRVHEQLYDALVRRDKDRARELMRQHIDVTQKNLSQFLYLSQFLMANERNH
jgi:DNA-binding FadR family transcriptional regulator